MTDIFIYVLIYFGALCLIKYIEWLPLQHGIFVGVKYLTKSTTLIPKKLGLITCIKQQKIKIECDDLRILVNIAQLKTV